MSFQAAMLSATTELRTLAESLMLDTCKVRYENGRGPQDEETGEEPILYADRIASSKCKFQAGTVGGSFAASEAGEREVLLGRLEVHLPQSSPAVLVDDQVVCLAVHPQSDARLVGRVFRVRSLDLKTLGTALRLVVEDITAEVAPVELP